MALSTWRDFIALPQNRAWKGLDGNPDAEYIFNEILSREENIIKMFDANAIKAPAITPVVREIEDYSAEQETAGRATMPFSEAGITDPAAIKLRWFNKQAIGAMVKTVLLPFGIDPAQRGIERTIPKRANAQWFKNAQYYVIDPSIAPTIRIVRHIEIIQ